MMENEILAANLKRLREKHEMNQEKFADEINVSRPTISNWESGKVRPTTDQFIRLAKKFNVSIDELLGINTPVEKWIIPDTSALIKRPRLINELSRRFDKVLISEIVISELNGLKDNNKKVKKQAWLAMSSIESVKNKPDTNVLIEPNKSRKELPDDMIIDLAITKTKEHPRTLIHVLSDDVYFSVQKKTPGIRFLSMREYAKLFHEKESKSDLKRTLDFVASVKAKNLVKTKEHYCEQLVNLNHIDASTGNTPLITAIRNRDEKMIEYLLTLPGVDINKRDDNKYGFPPIAHAIQLKDIELVKKLIEAGCDVDVGSSGKNAGNTPLMVAAWHGLKEIVELLFESGACVNQQDTNGFTPLMKACIRNHPDVAKYISDIEKTDLLIRDRDGLTAKDHAMRAKNNELRGMFS